MRDKLLLSVLIIVIPAINCGAEKYSCQSIASGVGPHCVTWGQQRVPPDLPTSITILNMERNYVRELSSDSLKRYRFLKELSLEGNDIESVSADAFTGLNYLTILNLRQNHKLKSLTNLPASLEFLDLSRCALFGYNDSDYLSNLKSLKQLLLQGAGLTQIPNLENVGGSLKTLDIQYNENLAKISVADLAPLCKLENLYVTVSKTNGNLCDCLAVQQWIDQYGIKGSNITCAERGRNVRCEQPVDLKEFENTRRNCYLFSTVRTYWIYGVGLLLILLCIVGCFVICRRMKCNQLSVLNEEET